MEIGVLYLSFAMMVLAELIVCPTRGFARILAKWFWPTVMSLSLTYGSPEASCNRRANTYFGRQSVGIKKEFWTLCIFFMTNGEVFRIYVSAEGSQFSMVIVDWLVCVSDVSVLRLDGDVLLVVKFWRLFFFSLFFCSIGFHMAGNLNDIPLMWCLFSSE